ncbi:MAG: hypothetical protein RL697_1078 [Pseudomonadota bacterium]|jgi:hypothetical protein
MAIRRRKALTLLWGTLAGVLLSTALMVTLHLDSWARWFDGLGKTLSPQPQTLAVALPGQKTPPASQALALWTRLPAHSQVDLVMLGLTQALERLGMQVQSMQVMSEVAKPAKDKVQTDGPQVLLSIRLLATYAQWMQWWQTSHGEGVAWWPVQLSMAPAAGQAQLQIEGQWRVLLSDLETVQGAWIADVHEWIPVQQALLPDPFGSKPMSPAASVPAGDSTLANQTQCAKNTLRSPVRGLQLVGLLEGGDQHPGQAVLRAGPCQWAVRVGQRVGAQGHVLHSLGPGASVWLTKENQRDGLRLKMHKKERP